MRTMRTIGAATLLAFAILVSQFSIAGVVFVRGLAPYLTGSNEKPIIKAKERDAIVAAVARGAFQAYQQTGSTSVYAAVAAKTWRAPDPLDRPLSLKSLMSPIDPNLPPATSPSPFPAMQVYNPQTGFNAYAKAFAVNLAQAPTTFTICTVAGGDIGIGRALFDVATTISGSTSFSIQDDKTGTPGILLPAVTVGGGINAQTDLPVANPGYFGLDFVPSGRHITATITGGGGGNAGSLAMMIGYITGNGGTCQP